MNAKNAWDNEIVAVVRKVAEAEKYVQSILQTYVGSASPGERNNEAVNCFPKYVELADVRLEVFALWRGPSPALHREQMRSKEEDIPRYDGFMNLRSLEELRRGADLIDACTSLDDLKAKKTALLVQKKSIDTIVKDVQYIIDE